MRTSVNTTAALNLILAFLFPLISYSGSEDTTTKWLNPRFEHISVKDGLPSNNVRHIIQDHFGFLWFATDIGLVRYDGYEMKLFQSETENPDSLSNNSISSVYEDSYGTIWAGTNRGLNAILKRFDRGTEKFKHYIFGPDDSLADRPNLLLKIFEDSKGRFWICTQYGLILLDRNTGEFKRFFYKRIEYNTEVYDYLTDLKNNAVTLASILHPGNNVNIKKEFTIDKNTDVLFMSMGDGYGDYGWIEDGTGNVFIKFDFDSSVCAGEYFYNRIFLSHKILTPGKYSIHYVSDAVHSYDNWKGPLPTFPEFWGASVFSLEGFESGIDTIVSAVHTEKNDYQFTVTLFENRLNGNLLVGGLPGLWKFDEKNEIIRQIPFPMFIFNIRSFYQIEDGSIFIATSRGLLKYNSNVGALKLLQTIATDKYNPENELFGGIQEVGGQLFIGTGGGKLICFNPETEKFKTYSYLSGDSSNLSPSSPIGITSMIKDSSGILWVSTSDFGLNKWDIYKSKFNSYKYNEDPWKRLGSSQVMSMIEDRSGTIWIGTYGGGLVKYSRNSHSFIHYINNPVNNNSISDNFVMAICEDPDEDGVLWIGTQNKGLNRFNSKQNSFEHIIHDPKEDNNTLGNNNIMYIMPDSTDLLWICTYGGGLKKYYKKTGKWERFLNPRKTGPWRGFLNFPEDSAIISSNRVWYTYKDLSGDLWIGTVNDLGGGGLNRYFYSTNTFRSFISETKNWDPRAITTVCEDKAGNFWVGDYTTGLYLFDRNKEEYKLNLTQKDGLSNNSIESILEDDSGNLWIGTGNGLTKYNTSIKSFSNYYEESGLSSNKFSFRCAFKSKTGEFYFGGENGFTWFRPEDVKDDPTAPPIVIDKISLFNRPDEKINIEGYIAELKSLELPYNQNDLRIDYAGLHLGLPSKNKYMYKMENFDEDWVDAGTERKAIYTNLDPGEYVFRVKAANCDGIWNEEGKSIKVIITPPWWQTWWFRVCFIISITGLFGGTIRYISVQKIKRRLEVEQERVRISNDMHDEIGSGLTRITLLSEVARKRLGESEEIRRISQASRDVVQNMDEIVWAVNPQYDTLENLALYMLQYAREFFGMTNIKLKTHYPEVITGEFVSAESRHCVFMVIKEVFNNIAKHADATEVQLIFNSSNRIYEFMIQDNGIGFDINSASKFSNGLNIMHKRINMLNGNLNIESSTGKGTKVIIKVPY